MKTANLNAPGSHAASSAKGTISTTRAGSRGIRFIDTSSGVDVIAKTVYVSGALVTDPDDDDDGVFVTIGTTGVLAPESTITVAKSQDNPTFDFASLPEGTIQLVSGTYYCPYIIQTDATDVRMATATSRDGPWTAHATPVLELTNITWDVGTTIMYAPEVIEVSGVFYLFYSIVRSDGATDSTNAIGVATCATINGTYVDSGAAVLSPGVASSPTSRRVGEPSVLYQGGVWNMAFMGEDSDLTYQESEKVFTATAPAATGPWTVTNSGNPVIDFGTGSSGYDALVADPFLFHANGYFWIMFAGSDTSTPSVIIQQYLAYATAIDGAWTVLDGPFLGVGASGAWDDTYAFRGSIYEEGGIFSGVYCGFDGTATFKGGNFTMSVSGVSPTPLAADVDITDVGGYYTGADVESALQEIGADIATLSSGLGGHWEVIVSGTGPPVAVTNEAGTDWVFGFVDG